MKKLTSSICTLFEGHYHHGVATLSNSIYNSGFRGTIYVGYKGELPDWIIKGNKEKIGKWDDAIVINTADDFKLIFLPLVTSNSLTNYKPDFMLELWQGPAEDTEALFYFDPDIVISDVWSCFEQWVQCGVAVCEDVNSPLQEYHPRRVGWRNYYKKYNVTLKFVNSIYVNGGFIGLIKKDIVFLKLWINLQELMAISIGGLDKSIFSQQIYSSSIKEMDGFNYFDTSDQDALNATIEVFNGTISYIGKNGMGFVPGKIMMHHAIGPSKPWQKKYLLAALKGRPPRSLDTAYWSNKNHPILAHSNWEIKRKKAEMNIAKFIGRFYKT
ncbi:hypothetical protein RCH18_002534 [Flavobacterium sp. PL11]|uniref:hypothetical protein n=1 Tax=Flavobacterium sp. PL11 TaxID=3071717 RepID=UPI002E04A7B5|nr:hypothetical protein [Flavobacterium sp. PL11]